MKTDPELDEALRRYRPAGPPPELRARVIAGTASARRTWPWAAAAAVLLAATIYFHASATRIVTNANIIASPDPTSQAVALLTTILGDDAAARAMAELIVMTEEMQAEREAGAEGSAPASETR